MNGRTSLIRTVALILTRALKLLRPHCLEQRSSCDVPAAWFVHLILGVCAVLTLAGVLFVGISSAQSINATITGRVTDSADKVLPGTTITVTNLNTRVVSITETNSEGLYRIANLLPGAYQVTVTKEGFKQAVQTNVALHVQDEVAVNLSLEIGSISESVTVQGGAETVQQESSSLGQVVQPNEVRDLPLNGRDYLQLASLASGSVPVLGPRDSLAANLAGIQAISVHVAGGRDDANSFLLDGIETRQPWVGNAGILPSVDAIQEFRVERGLYPAQFGQGTGIIGVATKAGTKAFHGGLYEFLRNDMFDALNYFDVQAEPFRQNQFGGTFGGPMLIPKLRKNTFFFFAYEGLRTRHSITQVGNFPTASQLQGDLSSVSAPIIDPTTGLQFTNAACIAQYGGVPKTNVICPNNFSRVAANYIPYIPRPNRNLAGADYITAPSRHYDYDQEVARIDEAHSNKDSIFGRVVLVSSGELIPGLARYFGSSTDLSGDNVVLRETHLFSPRAVNGATIGFNRSTLANPIQNTPVDVGSAIGLQNLDLQRSDWGMPAMLIVGYSQMGQRALNQGSTTNMFQGTESLSFQRGRHQIMVGTDGRFYQFLMFQSLLRQGNAVFTGSITGNPIADFLVGDVTSDVYEHGTIHNHSTSYNWSAFAQDDWQVNPGLTWNLGIRWEYNTDWVEKNGQGGFFDTSYPGGIIRLLKNPSDFGFQGSSPLLMVGGVRPGIVKPEYRDWAPRLGFAYRPFKDFVVRGGTGIFYGTALANDQTQFAMFLPPFIIAPFIPFGTNLDSIFPNVLAPNYQLTGVAPFSVDPNARRPYVEQWGLSIEKTMGGFLFEIGYQGSHGLHNWERVDVNQAVLPAPNDPNKRTDEAIRRPFPNFGPVLQATYREKSYYDALQTRVEREYHNGLSFSLSYVFSHAIDTASGGTFSTSHQNMMDLDAEKGSSGYNVPNALSFAHTYALPFGGGRKFLSTTTGLWEQLVNGWQINGILTLLSGQPFSATVAGDQALVGGYYTERANVSGSPSLPSSQRSVNDWFNTAAFSTPVLGTFGNSGRNILKGPPVRTYDFSLFKNFNLEGSRALQLRVEAFNAFNHPNFNFPASDPSAPATFGVITSARDPREIQLALRFSF